VSHHSQFLFDYVSNTSWFFETQSKCTFLCEAFLPTKTERISLPWWVAFLWLHLPYSIVPMVHLSSL
jgi:hypothetical protein